MTMKLICAVGPILLACVSCATGGDLEAEPIIPSNAINLKRETLQIEEGEKSPSLRTKYQLKKEYPSTDVVGFYEEEMSPRGWVLCRRSNDGKRGNGWEDYFQGEAGKEKRVVRQLFKYLVNDEKKEVISIRLHYLGSEKTGLNEQVEWDLSNQYVDVVHYKFVSEKYNDILTLYKKIGLDCGD